MREVTALERAEAIVRKHSRKKRPKLTASIHEAIIAHSNAELNRRCRVMDRLEMATRALIRISDESTAYQAGEDPTLMHLQQQSLRRVHDTAMEALSKLNA